MSTEGSGPAEVPAASGSPLADLRARRERAKKKLYLDLKVPRLQPPVGVRYAPLDKTAIDDANERMVTGNAKDREIVAKSALLARHCLGVFSIDDDGKPIGPPSSWPKFDAELAELLGLPESAGGVELVRDLYLAEGDILAALGELSEWSGQSERLQAEADEGN